jgi:DnaK suppressor protein
MDEKTLYQFKTDLNTQLQELLNSAERSKQEFRAEKQICCDPIDMAAMEVQRNYNLRIRDREAVLIKKIQAALRRIKDGDYGICEECGEDIALGRLKARPTAELCIQCKQKQENEEKQSRLSYRQTAMATAIFFA